MACGLGQVSAPGSPLRGVRVPAPLHVAGFGIARFQEAGNVHRVAAHADHDVILHDQRAMVQKYCIFSSATFLRQRSLPSFAFSEMNQQSGVMK